MAGSEIPTHSILDKVDHLIHIAPFPYVAIDEALPWPLYDKLSKEFPETEILAQREYGENQRVDIHAKNSGLVSPQWRKFIDYHTSAQFWHDIVRVFGDAIRLVYPGLEMQNGPMDDWDTVIRGLGQGTVNMECQPGVNTPLTKAGRVRGPHLDNPVELAAGLLYMGEGEGGDLEISKFIKQPAWHGKLELEDDCVEVVGKIKYRPNMLVMFLNTPVSIHGVTPRQPTTECRRLCNFAAEMNSPLFQVGHGRY